MSRNIITLTALWLLSYKAYGDTNYRLNTPVVPSSYAIRITPYFNTSDDRAFTFDGDVTIRFITMSDSNQIKIHSEDLKYNASNIEVTSMIGTSVLNSTNPLQFDQKYSFAYINLQSDLTANIEYTLKISYQGPIRTDLTGFYRNYYIENGVKKWLGATQMESTHARKVFPCFDEPALKAVFTLTIDRPQSYKQSLANTKLQASVLLPNGYIRETFYPTPKMSTYLVAFLVSEFEAAEYATNGTKELGVFTRPEATNQSAYAFDFGKRVVDALGDYFGIDYYSTNNNLKLDHIALPDFRAGAMENWGLIKYREALLLYVPSESAPYYKYRVAQIVAHETTHMWFGNLVTCHWWSNTWLNEGFANYFQDYITALIEPEVGSIDILVTGSVYDAYTADQTPGSPPITNNNVNSPAEISAHFGTITYQKAGSVIRMIHHLIGDEAFRKGLNTYLRNNEFDVGYPNRLYDALQSSLSDSTLNITDVMSPWITQAGYPFITVDVDYADETVKLTQQRFYSNSSNESNELYKIPITYTTGKSPDFNNTKPVFIMENRTHEFTISNISQDHSWIILNVQETGLYRVNYDDHSWKMIANALKGDNREQIHHLNRAKIVNDLFAFYFAEEVHFDVLHEVLEFLRNETHYSVWFAAIRGLNHLRTVYLGTDVLNDIDNYALRLVENIIDELGYDVKSTDDFVTLRNRMQILEFACKLGHQGCIDNAVEMFDRFRDNSTEVTPSLRPIVYCNGLRFGNGDDFEFLWRRMSTTNVANEARLIGDALGCSTDEQKLNSYLFSMNIEDSPIRLQDFTVPLTSVLSNHSHVHIVLESLQQNFDDWNSIHSLETVLLTVAAAIRTEAELNQFDSWLTSCSRCSDLAVASAKNTIAISKASAVWAHAHQAELLNNLRSHALTTTPSVIIITLSLISILLSRVWG